MVHVGVDLHKRISQIAVLDGAGEIQQHRVSNDPEQIVNALSAVPKGTEVAIEATGTWWWFVDLLEQMGHVPVLSNPKQTRAIASARLKNDRVDAERLAILLRGDLLPAVWIAPRELREARELLRHRMSLVWTRTEVKNRLLAMLARRNLQPTARKSWLSVGGRRELAGLALGESPDRIRQDTLALLRMLDEQVRALDKELRRRWGQDRRVERLMTVPGIGPFVAIALVLELGEIDRFPSAKHLAGYLGLTPRIRSSAGRTRTGHISKEGNRLLRWLLVIAATQAARRPGPLKAYFQKLRQRKGTKIARVALARRLVEIVYQVWKNEIDYWGFLRRGGVRG